MRTLIGILTEAGGRAPIADEWRRSLPEGSGPTVSPPAPFDETCRNASILVLDFPAARLSEVLTRLNGLVGAQTAIISLSPEVPLDMMRALVGAGPSMFRAVVPTGIKAGEGAAALAAEPGTPVQTVENARQALAWIGSAEVVGEEQLDVVAGLVYGGATFLCEAFLGLEGEAVREGLSGDSARTFVSHTALATALLLRDHSRSPADLKDQVASPGGTTIAALATLEDARVRGACIRAVEGTVVEIRGRQEAVRRCTVGHDSSEGRAK